MKRRLTDIKTEQETSHLTVPSNYEGHGHGYLPLDQDTQSYQPQGKFRQVKDSRNVAKLNRQKGFMTDPKREEFSFNSKDSKHFKDSNPPDEIDNILKRSKACLDRFSYCDKPPIPKSKSNPQEHPPEDYFITTNLDRDRKNEANYTSKNQTRKPQPNEQRQSKNEKGQKNPSKVSYMPEPREERVSNGDPSRKKYLDNNQHKRLIDNEERLHSRPMSTKNSDRNDQRYHSNSDQQADRMGAYNEYEPKPTARSSSQRMGDSKAFRNDRKQPSRPKFSSKDLSKEVQSAHKRRRESANKMKIYRFEGEESQEFQVCSDFSKLLGLLSGYAASKMSQILDEGITEEEVGSMERIIRFIEDQNLNL